MGHLITDLLRWVLRNAYTFIVILAVVFLGNWLHREWKQAEAARTELKQLQTERPATVSQILQASNQLQEQLRSQISTQDGARKINDSLSATINAKRLERDRLVTDHPIAVKLPTSPEFKRVAVLEVELSMLEQAKTQVKDISSLASAVADNKSLIAELKLQRNIAQQKVSDNRQSQSDILNDNSFTVRTAAKIPGTFFYDQLKQLKANLPDLEKEVDKKQSLIDGQTLALRLAEKRLNDARHSFLSGNESAEKAMNTIDARIAALELQAKSDIQSQAYLALSILIGVIVFPTGIKCFLYYIIAPLAERHPPVVISTERQSNAHDPVQIIGAGVSLPIRLEESSELLVHSSYLQSTSLVSSKSTAHLLDWSYPLTSLAAGMYALTRIRAAHSDAIVVSSSDNPLMELAVLDIPSGGALVFHPRYLVGAVQKQGFPVHIESKWRLGYLHSWLTLQLRYLVFHGPARLIVRGCRGVRLEQSGSGRLINQSATLGFTADTAYSVTRCETFLAYWRGEQELFNDKFSGDSGAYIYEEIPSRSGKAGVSGRGLEGLLDASLKAFGV